MGSWSEGRAQKAQVASERRNAEYLARSRRTIPARDLGILAVACGLGYLLLPPLVWVPVAILGIGIDLAVRRAQRQRAGAERAAGE